MSLSEWQRENELLIAEIQRLKRFERWYESADSTPVLEKLDEAQAKVKDAFETGFALGASNQIDEDEAWEYYNE